MLKHKNLESLKHYLDATTLEDKENYAKSLFNYTDNTCDNSDIDNFEEPPSHQEPVRPKKKCQQQQFQNIQI